MNNKKIREFERNRYFTGKLLTVNDFMTEQKYFNDKRRFLNRILHGAGVVTGLRVVRVDGQNVTLEPGAALDHFGREIVVFSPKNLRLSSMEGFINNEYDKNVYLCLGYQENETEAVYSAVNSSVSEVGDKVRENSRYSESYRVFIKETPPLPEKIEAWNLLYRTSVLYEGDGVRVLLQTPRYVQKGEQATITVRVEKILKVQDLILKCQVFARSKDNEEPLSSAQVVSVASGRQTTVEGTGRLNMPTIDGAKLLIEIRPEESLLQIGDRTLLLSGNVKHEIKVIDDSVQERLLQDYLRRPISQLVEATDEECIYLAKINLVKEVNTYRIEQVEEVPFGQYVYNSTILRQLEGVRAGSVTEEVPLSVQPVRKEVEREELIAAVNDFVIKTSADYVPASEKPQLSVDYNRRSREFNFQLGVPLPEVQRESTKVTTGVVTIPLAGHGKWFSNLLSKPPRSYFSDEIPHGLGTGNVYVQVGIEVERDDVVFEMNNRDECVYYGDLDVFDESDFDSEQPNVALGTMLYPKKGTFRIGVKPLEPTQQSEVKVRWWAFQTLEERQGRDKFAPHKREAAAAGEENEE